MLKRFLDWLAVQTPQRRVIAYAAEYVSLAGNRQIEFRPLTSPQVDRRVGEIRTIRAKQRGKKREQIVEVIGINPLMSNVLDRLEVIREGRECLYVFPTRDRNQYRVEASRSSGSAACSGHEGRRAQDRGPLHLPRPLRVLRDAA